MNPTPGTEDRLWAVLAHLSALSFGMGILLPVVGWSDQRRKSNYASFQCLQALGYQSVGFTIWVLSYLVIIILGSILMLALSLPVQESNPNVHTDTALSPAILTFLLLAFGGFALYFVLPIIAAIACARGRDFRYPVMGERLRRYLAYDPAQSPDRAEWLHEGHEFRWVAAMGHFSILVLIWGMLAPLAAWILQGKNSRFLRLQSIQTLIYQAIATILFFVGTSVYLLGIVLLFAVIGAMGTPDLSSSTGIISLVVLGAAFLISAAIILLVPLLHIMGQWAGYRVLKGDDYLYPWIGRLVQKRISKQSTGEEEPG